MSKTPVFSFVRCNVHFMTHEQHIWLLAEISSILPRVYEPTFVISIYGVIFRYQLRAFPLTLKSGSTNVENLRKIKDKKTIS
jgi:hypothetical protein